MTEAGEVRGTLGTVRKLLLLDLLTDGPAYQHLTALAERSGLAVPTVHRLLRSLVLADLVEQDPRTSRYSLGPEVARLSQRYLGRLPILGALSPYLVSLRDQIGATIHVAVLVRETVVYVDRIDAGEGGPYRDSHRVLHALATASGRLLAARADDEVWRRCLEVVPLEEEPRELRSRWATAPYLQTSDHDGVSGEVSVPVTDGSGTMLAALAASVGPTVDAGRVGQVVTHLARAAGAAGRTLSGG